jgi:hypothetical protein
MAGTKERAARAIAFFESCGDAALLHEVLDEIAPRAKRAVAAYLRRGGEEAIPGPAELGPARQMASAEEALATVREMDDFPLLQALAKAVGRRVEAIEIAASAEFPEGARVLVPRETRYPAGEPRDPGTVVATGMSLAVLLDSGETWRGPASLVRLAGR